jgi:esterase/lipase superfamily enzyme
MKDVREWLQAIAADATADGVDDQPLQVVFFVHGYNTPPLEALKRQRLVESELRKRNLPCMVVGFDWPTGESAAGYLWDRNRASGAALSLVTDGIFPFALFTQDDCKIQVSIMAHSMGGYVVREAFRGADKARTAQIPSNWRVGQMVFFAADVSSSCFATGGEMEPVFSHSGRLTNYFSGYDTALAVSNVKNMDISSRVGRVGMPADKPTSHKAIDVNCGDQYASRNGKQFKVIDGMESHSWYLEDSVWYDDLVHTLRGEFDRNLITTRRPDPSGLADDFILVDA